MMNTIKINELQRLNGMNDAEFAKLLWPESNAHTRRVLLARWRKDGVKTITLDQLRTLSETFGTTNLNNLIQFDYEQVNQ